MLNLKGVFEDTNAAVSPSQTVPNQSLTVREVMERYAAGIPAQLVSQAFYEDELDEIEIKDELSKTDGLEDAATAIQGSDIVDLSEMAEPK